jgi:glycosyltransferase involved in cell wall biosynthesis
VIGGGSGNGIDVSRFADDVLPTRAEARERFGLPAEATVVGFVGRFTRDKGIADLTQVFTSTLRQRPDVWLLLVGQFEDGDPVRADVRATIEHDERIVTVPWLDHPGVAYRAMDLLAFPSYREGLPNVPLEAQLCGVPVVGYAATGTVDAVAPGSAVVTVGDVDALSGEIVAQVDAGIGRSSSERQEATWVVENFERARLWSGLVDRYRAWVLAS